MNKLEVIILLFMFLFFLSFHNETKSNVENIQKEIQIMKANIEEIYQENTCILKKLKINNPY